MNAIKHSVAELGVISRTYEIRVAAFLFDLHRRGMLTVHVLGQMVVS
jgi:hypothetical protein